MKIRFNRVRNAVCAAALCVGIVPGAMAHTLRLNGDIDFTENVILGTPVPCAFVGVIHGSGRIPSVGPVTFTSTDCGNPQSPLSLFPSDFDSMNVVMDTPRGKLFAIYHGVLTADGSIRGVFQVIGGTNHFVGAVGSGILTGFEAVSIDFQTGSATGSGTIHLDGKITY